MISILCYNEQKDSETSSQCFKSCYQNDPKLCVKYFKKLNTDVQIERSNWEKHAARVVV